jgi:predicted nucleic acid-binding protein
MIPIDTNFLYGLFNQSERNHAQIKYVSDNAHSQFGIPTVVLPEISFLFIRDFGYPEAGRFFTTPAESQPNQIATLDRRHFTVYQPNHCDHFELVP